MLSAKFTKLDLLSGHQVDCQWTVSGLPIVDQLQWTEKCVPSWNFQLLAAKENGISKVYHINRWQSSIDQAPPI